MSDKQTTAVILLVVLSLVFYLYHTQKLASLVAIITGGNAQQIGQNYNVSTDAAYITTQAQTANVSYAQFASGQDTAYTLNSIFNIPKGAGSIQYSQPASSSAGSDNLSNLSTLIGLYGQYAGGA